MDLDGIKLIFGLAIAVLGWAINHYLSDQRMLKQKRRDISTEHLINAYRVLVSDIANRPMNPDRKRKLENILSEIQLFGSEHQVNLSQQMINEFSDNGSVELNPLINSLKNELRKELELANIESEVKWLRFKN